VFVSKLLNNNLTNVENMCTKHTILNCTLLRTYSFRPNLCLLITTRK